MDFHLAGKDINRYPKRGLSWPFVHYSDFLSRQHVYGKGSRAETWDGPVNASPADSWGAGGVSSGSWRDLPLLCAAGFQRWSRRICLPSWKKILVKPKTTDVTILSGYSGENSAFEAMEYSFEHLKD